MSDPRHRPGAPAPALVSGLAHELRTPLSSILMMAELLSEGLGEGAGEGEGEAGRQARYARNVRRAAEDLLELVDQAGELARIEAGRLAVEPRPLAASELARRIAEDAGRAAGAAGAAGGRLAVAVAAGAPETVVTDPERLARAAGLVVGAALHASGGGAVAARLEAAPGGGLALRVTDSGPPLSAAERDALFVPFAAAGPRTARRFGGTGLGLPLAHALAALLGASLSAEPGPEGRGCVFVLAVPERR